MNRYDHLLDYYYYYFFYQVRRDSDRKAVSYGLFSKKIRFTHIVTVLSFIVIGCRVVHHRHILTIAPYSNREGAVSWHEYYNHNKKNHKQEEE